MSQRCIYKLQQLRTASNLKRNICTSKLLLQNNNNHENDQEKKVKKGFFERFKTELMKDMESDETNKETINKYKEQFEKFNSKYEMYKDTMHKYAPKFSKSEKPEDTQHENNQNLMEKLKAKLEKEQLLKDYASLKDQLMAKSEDISKRWHERRNKVPEAESDDKVTDKKNKMTKMSDDFGSKFKDLYEKSGVAENPMYQKAMDQTKSIFNEHKEKLDGVSKAAFGVRSRSNDIKQTFTEKGKLYSESLNKQFKEVGRKVDEGVDAVEKSGIRERSKEALDMSKKALEKTEQMAKETADKLAKEKDDFQNSEKFKKVTEATQESLKTAATVAEDFYDTTKLKESEIYKSPEQLKKRIEHEDEEAKAEGAAKKVKVNEDATGVVEHKGWKWESSWKNFKEQNPLVQKLMDIRESLEESDNIFARAGYKVIDSVHNVFAGMLQPSEISNTIAEIQKMDSDFDINRFSATLRSDIVPYVVEAYLRSDLEILESWCQERAMGQFKHMIAAREFTGTIQLIDIGDCEILTGVMLELGPVFMFNVSTQQLYRQTVTASTADGEAAETIEDTIKQVVYTIAVCRDQTMFDSTAAWRVLEIIEHITHEKYF